MNQTNRNRASSVSDEMCALYESYGFTQYNMSKFEAYDLYVRNKDFLISDSIITFTLKPWTVWITKNCGKFFKRWKYQTT